jgi:hypothetical protein
MAKTDWFTFLKSEENKTFFENIKNAFTAIAIIVGAVWTLFNFTALDTFYKSKLELIGKPSLSCTLDYHIVPPVDTVNKIGLVIRLTIQNSGSRYLHLDADDALEIAKVSCYDNTEVFSLKSFYPKAWSVLGERYIDKDNLVAVDNKSISAIDIQQNSTKLIEYYCEVKDSGLYFIGFNSKNNDIKKGDNKIDGDIPVGWVCARYIYIGTNSSGFVGGVGQVGVPGKNDKKGYAENIYKIADPKISDHGAVSGITPANPPVLFPKPIH